MDIQQKKALWFILKQRERKLFEYFVKDLIGMCGQRGLFVLETYHTLSVYIYYRVSLIIFPHAFFALISRSCHTINLDWYLT